MENTELRGSREVTTAEKLYIFLLICSHGIKFRVAAEMLSLYRLALSTVRAFHEVLSCLLHKPQRHLEPPGGRRKGPKL